MIAVVPMSTDRPRDVFGLGISAGVRSRNGGIAWPRRIFGLRCPAPSIERVSSSKCKIRKRFAAIRGQFCRYIRLQQGQTDLSIAGLACRGRPQSRQPEGPTGVPFSEPFELRRRTSARSGGYLRHYGSGDVSRTDEPSLRISWAALINPLAFSHNISHHPYHKPERRRFRWRSDNETQFPLFNWRRLSTGHHSHREAALS